MIGTAGLSGALILRSLDLALRSVSLPFMAPLLRVSLPAVAAPGLGRPSPLLGRSSSVSSPGSNLSDREVEGWTAEEEDSGVFPREVSLGEDEDMLLPL